MKTLRPLLTSLLLATILQGACIVEGDGEIKDDTPLIELSATEAAAGDTIQATVQLTEQPKTISWVGILLVDHLGNTPVTSGFGAYDGLNPVTIDVPIEATEASGIYLVSIMVLTDTLDCFYFQQYSDDTHYYYGCDDGIEKYTSQKVAFVTITNPNVTAPTQFVDTANIPDLMGQPSFSSAQAAGGDTISLSVPVDADTERVTIELKDINGISYLSSSQSNVESVPSAAETIVLDINLDPYFQENIILYPEITLSGPDGSKIYKFQYNKLTGVDAAYAIIGLDMKYKIYPPLNPITIGVGPQTPMPALPALGINSPITLNVDGATTEITANTRHLTFNSQALPFTAKLSFTAAADTGGGSATLFKVDNGLTSYSGFITCTNLACDIDLLDALSGFSAGTYQLKISFRNASSNYHMGYFDNDGSGFFSSVEAPFQDLLRDYRYLEAANTTKTTTPYITVTLN